MSSDSSCLNLFMSLAFKAYTPSERVLLSSFLKSLESCQSKSFCARTEQNILLFPELCRQDWLFHFSACLPTSLTYSQQGSVQTLERTWSRTVLADGKNLEEGSNSQWHFSVASGWLFSQSCHLMYPILNLSSGPPSLDKFLQCDNT